MMAPQFLLVPRRFCICFSMFITHDTQCLNIPLKCSVPCHAMWKGYLFDPK